MSFKKIFYLTILVLLLSLIPIIASADPKFEEGSIDVNGTPLYLRPTEDAPIVCELQEGARVGVYDEEGDFVRVIFGNYRGYIKRDMLFVPSEDSYDAKIYSSGLRVRVSPGTYSTVITQVKEDTPIKIVDVFGEWYKVEISAEDCDSDTDVTGFVAKEFVLVTPNDGEQLILKPTMSGSRVKTLQKELKARGFLSASATGYYGSATKQAVADFQLAANLSPDGIAGEHTLELLYADNDIKAVVRSSSSSSSGSSSGGSGITTGSGGGRINFYTTSATSAALAKVGSVQKSDWSTIDKRWPVGKVATITVVATGQQFQMVRGGYTNHADSAPRTASDTAVLRATYGGRWSWARCPVWVTVGGNTYAASINGMPHGEEYVYDNGLAGHICVHFNGSIGHSDPTQDPDHQAAVDFAYNAAKG